MKLVYITPCKDFLLAEIHEKSSEQLRNAIRQTEWLSWKKMKDVNGKAREQWYIVVDTSVDKESRLTQFAKILCDDEGYMPSSRICPHDWYYEDYQKYFEEYK